MLLWTRRQRTSFPVRLQSRRLLTSDVSLPPFIQINKGTFYKQYPTDENADSNPPLFPGLEFDVRANEPPVADQRKKRSQHWAVIGPSGKTELLNIIRGQYICVPPNARTYPHLLKDEIVARDPRLRIVQNAVQYLGFSGGGSGSIGGTRAAYLGARYESHREETDWTLEQFLRGQTSLNPLEGQEHGFVNDEEHWQKVISDLRLTHLLDMPVANLSNGQTRLARIAQVLLRKPELLLLDEPFTGLDPPTAGFINTLLRQLAWNCSPRILFAFRPQDTVPDWITHLALVGKSHQVVLQGRRTLVERALEIWNYVLTKEPSRKVPAPEKLEWRHARALLKSGALDEQLMRDFIGAEPHSPAKILALATGGEPLIRMEGVRVEYNGKVVLGGFSHRTGLYDTKREGLYWTLRRGQRWALLGANGSGKTTLLSLLTSDHPQSYALPIQYFGRSRLPKQGKPGISLFELQSRMGQTSPELHAVFPRQLTLRQTLESAFADTPLSKPQLDHEQDLDIDALLQMFKPELCPRFTKQSNENVDDKTFDDKWLPNLRNLDGRGLHLKNQYQNHIEIDYADEVLFGELTFSQQRIALFLRAIARKPDILLLDEPFAGLTPAERAKCHKFLERGERGTKWRDLPAKRYMGLSEDQALVMISHVKEDFPDFVRHWMRLPSPAGEKSNPLDFCMGTLRQPSRLNDPETWKLAWSPLSTIQEKGGGRRRVRKKHETMEREDSAKIPWWTL